MTNLHGIEELIRIDCDRMIYLLTEIKNLHELTTNEEEFKKAKILWKESKEIAHRMKKLEYSEEHILPVVRKKIIHLLEKVHKEVQEL